MQKSMNINGLITVNSPTSTIADGIIPSAAHARQCTLSEAQVEQYKIAKSIYEAMHKGHRRICLNQALSQSCLTELMRLGYDVSTDHDAQSQTLTYISWQ